MMPHNGAADVDLAILEVVLDDIDSMLSNGIPPNPNRFYCFHPNANNISNDPNYYIQNTSLYRMNPLESVSNMSPVGSPSPNSITNDVAIGSTSFSAKPSEHCTVFKPYSENKVELKDHVFISKDATQQLSQYIVEEAWGRDCVVLYKYLDYIFRCQLFNHQIVKIAPNQCGFDSEYLVFHTGLRRRRDDELLYGLLTPNFISQTHKNKQKWRVQFGNIEDSFLTKSEIFHKFRSCSIPYLPRRTIFSDSPHDSIFNASYAIEVSWEERLIVNQDRIYRIIGKDAYFDNKRKHLKLTELIQSFDAALNATKRMLSFNPELAVPQGFIDTKRFSYRMELLVPLIVQFPKNNSKSYTFALAIGKCTEQMDAYSVKSVLTLNMGYANARLVGYVNSLWLRFGNK